MIVLCGGDLMSCVLIKIEHKANYYFVASYAKVDILKVRVYGL